ncbi:MULTISPECIES: helix-turn-helix transcriptional regulator [unclassified Halomonas]|uniref:helix-turn-helix transcriptional regulator n=1 Tax=unclassified Halomonas TaxID=2609666 RepID=UPI00403422CF
MKPGRDASYFENSEIQPDFAAAIGERVRAYRARRGITRKHLSDQSDISERYLAKIETGKANISLDLLMRLAQAMVIPVHDLLPTIERPTLPAPLNEYLQRLSPIQLEEAHQLLIQHFQPAREYHFGIALIGIRFGGKTTLGELLAMEFGLPFIRLSQVIEAQGGMKVGEVLELGGQRTYRRLEREALEWVIQEHPLSVLEVGGGLVTEPETFQQLLSNFYTVWLKAAPKELMRRLMTAGDVRPLEGNNYDHALEDLTRILTERDADYRQADYLIETTDRTVKDCFQELINVSKPIINLRIGQTADNT